MPYQDILPPVSLSAYIKCFWSVKRSFAVSDRPVEILPDSYKELIFSFGSACILVEDHSERQLPVGFAVNLLDAPLYIRADGEIYIIGVRLYPFMCLGFLNAPQPIIDLPLQLLKLHAEISKITDQQPTEAVLKRFEEHFLSSRELFDTDVRLLNSCQAIILKKGVITAAEVADASFTTNRTLERMFRKIIGETPKGLARKVRFEFIRNFLWNYPDANLTNLAYTLNFTDLAHFSNEFRNFSKQSPTDFIAYVRLSKKDFN